MSYLVLARKYRPADFDSVIGQEHITGLLKKAITAKRVAHAYLFCGPRGIGKTSCARILAKSLNCAKGVSLKPCGECSSCKEIASGNSFDVLEIDGASNRGIDEIRTLRENVKFAPTYGKYKIYIVDEVHMLTMEAFNALLKTLEEPPEHVKFIFATTDPNKVPATIISRCQRYDFKRISLKETVDELVKIAKKEKVQIDQDALYAIAKASQGSFRDALSILDQISALSEREIKGDDVFSMLGLVETDLVFALGEAVGQNDCADALKTFDTIIAQGKDIKQLYRDLIEHFRNLMVIKIGGKALGKLVDYPVPIKEMYLKQTGLYSLKKIIRALDILIEAQDMARVTESLRTPLEIAFAKLTYVEGDDGGRPAAAAPDRAARPAPARTAPPEPKRSEPPSRIAPGEFLKNKRGEVDLSPAPADEDVPEMMPEQADAASGDVTLDSIKKAWDKLTYAVSREKMSVATYLQEGFPVEYAANKLTIGFAQEFAFHKETLETNEYHKLVERIFSDILKAKIIVKYILAENTSPAGPAVDDEPIVQTALDQFGGKIISKWHND